jgi:hypothetical protein
MSLERGGSGALYSIYWFVTARDALTKSTGAFGSVLLEQKCVKFGQYNTINIVVKLCI